MTTTWNVCDSVKTGSISNKTWKYVSGTYYDTTGTISSTGCYYYTKYVLTVLNKNITKSTNSLSSNQSGGSYQWVKCPISTSPTVLSTSQTFTPTSAGNYAVILTIGNCVDTSLCVSWAPVGVNDISTTNFEIYPNPVNNLLNISSSVNINSVSITNIVGQTMFINKYNNTNKLVLDMSKFEKGVYFVKVNNSINKILKQ